MGWNFIDQCTVDFTCGICKKYSRKYERISFVFYSHFFIFWFAWTGAFVFFKYSDWTYYCNYSGSVFFPNSFGTSVSEKLVLADKFRVGNKNDYLLLKNSHSMEAKYEGTRDLWKNHC